MNDQKNTILAIVLSAIVLIGWQYFIGMPQMERQKQDALLKQQQTQQAQPPQAAPNAGAPAPQSAAPRPPGQADVTTPAEQKSREAALAATARIPIDTPAIKGSIALKGGRLDDISLARYHETVDPSSPAIVLLSPSGSPHPFYAEFGWVGGAGANVKTPGPDTVWQREGAGSLEPGQPITLVYDNGEGLKFRRTIAVDDKYLFTLQGRGHQQHCRAGDALSLRVDLTPRPAADVRLLHPARGHDRRDGGSGPAGDHLQDDRRQEEPRLQGDRCLDGHHRQVLGGDAAAEHRRPGPGALFRHRDRRGEDLPDRLSARCQDDRAGHDGNRGRPPVRRRQGGRAGRDQFPPRRHRRLQPAARASTTSIC